MNIENLKAGDVFFDAEIQRFQKYEYLMEYPFKNPKNKDGSYHIVINKLYEEPIRMHKTALQKIIDKNLTNLEDVRNYQIKITTEHLEYLKQKI